MLLPWAQLLGLCLPCITGGSSLGKAYALETALVPHASETVWLHTCSLTSLGFHFPPCQAVARLKVSVVAVARVKVSVVAGLT